MTNYEWDTQQSRQRIEARLQNVAAERMCRAVEAGRDGSEHGAPEKPRQLLSF